MIEQGLIGLALIGWGVVDVFIRWWRLPKTPIRQMLGGIGFAFLGTSLVSFPDHLWVLGVMGLIAYCGIWMLSAQRSMV